MEMISMRAAVAPFNNGQPAPAPQPEPMSRATTWPAAMLAGLVCWVGIFRGLEWVFG
jgi:hypothetical protein